VAGNNTDAQELGASWKHLVYNVIMPE